MNLKKGLKKGAGEAGKKSAKAGGGLATAGVKRNPGAVVEKQALGADAGTQPIPAKQSFFLNIVKRIVAGRGAGQKSGNPEKAPPQKGDEKSKKSVPSQAGTGGVSVASLKQDIANAQEALKNKDLKAAGTLYDAITTNYNLMVFGPKCDIKAAKALYEDILPIYNALSKSRSTRGKDIVFKPLNEAGAADKTEKKDASLPSAGKEASQKGGSAKPLAEEQVIYTVIDSVIEIVDSKSEISLQELSKILNMSADQIEEIAKILDEHGILQLHYPSNPLAHPLLRSISKHDFKRLGRQD